MKDKIYLKSNKDIVEKNEEIQITVVAENSNIVACDLYIYFDNNKFEFISGPENSNFVSDYVVWVWHDENGGSKSKTKEISRFIFKAKENGIAKFNMSGNFYDSSLNQIDTEFGKLQIKVGKDTPEDIQIEENDSLNTNLEMLAVENIQLSPLFDNNITDYEIELGNQEELNIFAVPENEKASCEIYGDKNLKEGSNLIRIIVTSQNGLNKKEYDIKAYKRSEKEEIEYQEKEEQNKEKLEDIYKAEKASFEQTSLENFPELENINNPKESPKSNFIIIILLIAVIILIFIGFKIKNKKK